MPEGINHPRFFQRRPGQNDGGAKAGFTLVELLVALMIGLIAIGAVYSVYLALQAEYRGQQARAEMHQNLRVAAVILEQQIRMAGFDPERSGQFGITDVRRYDLVDTRANPGGEPALFYTADLDENGAPDSRNNFRNREFANFRIVEQAKSKRRCLAWDNGGGRRVLAEDIGLLCFAFSIDADGDGRRDAWAGGSHLIWAVDSDNDNLLDTHLDANGDGLIDEKDDTDGDGRISAADGARIDPPLPLTCIRAVRVWLLSVSARPMPKHVDQGLYVVGDRIVKANGDGHVRRLLERTVEGRNL